MRPFSGRAENEASLKKMLAAKRGVGSRMEIAENEWLLMEDDWNGPDQNRIDYPRERL
jgi:hypothetical protein